jgi:hypothetical protein
MILEKSLGLDSLEKKLNEFLGKFFNWIPVTNSMIESHRNIFGKILCCHNPWKILKAFYNDDFEENKDSV